MLIGGRESHRKALIHNFHCSSWSISDMESVMKLVESIRQKKKSVSHIIIIGILIIVQMLLK